MIGDGVHESSSNVHPCWRDANGWLLQQRVLNVVPLPADVNHQKIQGKRIFAFCYEPWEICVYEISAQDYRPGDQKSGLDKSPAAT
jgi:hypothetical protein